jgi:hypothetical protein
MKTLILNWVFNEFMLWIASKRLGLRFYLYHQSVFQTGQRWIAYLDLNGLMRVIYRCFNSTPSLW